MISNMNNITIKWKINSDLSNKETNLLKKIVIYIKELGNQIIIIFNFFCKNILAVPVGM